MKQKATCVLLILTLAGALLATNCATITARKTEQGIPVTSVPAGATIIVNGVKQGVTPLVIWLARKWKGHVVRIESPGYNPVEIRLGRKLSGGVLLGNFLLGIVPGILPAMAYGMEHDKGTNISAGSILIWGLSAAAFGGLSTLIDGAKGYTLHPKDLTVTLTKVDGLPRVDTILVDAENFRNVKWIRVHRD